MSFPLIHMFFEGVQTQEMFTTWYQPVMITFLCTFFITFDFSPNFYAELTGFADRQFYQDFWNATNFDEYNRKWNRIVHEYLHRHFFLEYLIRYRVTIFQSVLITFLFSVLFHEIFFTLSFGRCSLYLSSLQFNQLLLTFLFTKLKGTLFGNMVYWFGQIFGVTSVAYNYYRDYYNYQYYKGGQFDI